MMMRLERYDTKSEGLHEIEFKHVHRHERCVNANFKWYNDSANVREGDLNNVHGFMLVQNDITKTQGLNFNLQVMKYQVM